MSCSSRSMNHGRKSKHYSLGPSTKRIFILRSPHLAEEGDIMAAIEAEVEVMAKVINRLKRIGRHNLKNPKPNAIIARSMGISLMNVKVRRRNVPGTYMWLSPLRNWRFPPCSWPLKMTLVISYFRAWRLIQLIWIYGTLTWVPPITCKGSVVFLQNWMKELGSCQIRWQLSCPNRR